MVEEDTVPWGLLGPFEISRCAGYAFPCFCVDTEQGIEKQRSQSRWRISPAVLRIGRLEEQLQETAGKSEVGLAVRRGTIWRTWDLFPGELEVHTSDGYLSDGRVSRSTMQILASPLKRPSLVVSGLLMKHHVQHFS